jgi:hypothetical protein
LGDDDDESDQREDEGWASEDQQDDEEEEAVKVLENQIMRRNDKGFMEVLVWVPRAAMLFTRPAQLVAVTVPAALTVLKAVPP